MAAVAGGRRAILLFIGAFLSVCIAAPAIAQYPPPPPTKSPKPHKTPKPKCTTTGTLEGNGGRGSNGGGFRPQREFERGETVAVRGGRGCAGPKERVTLSIGRGEGKRRLGASQSTKTGAYTVSGRVPPSARYGKHELTISSSGATHRTTMQVVAGGGSRRSLASGPMLAVWFALAGIVAAYVLGTRRRRRPAAAAPSLEVPLIDTWDFVGVLPGRRRGGASAKEQVGGEDPQGAPSKPKTKPKPKSARPTAATPKAGAKQPPKPAVRKAGGKAGRKAGRKAGPTSKRKVPRAPKRSAGGAKPPQPESRLEKKPKKEDPDV